jgi:hypothetical protein
MRQYRRDAEAAIAEQGKQLVDRVARMEAHARATTEVKFKLQRARKESLILADEDPELKAKFGILDDELFQLLRIDVMTEDD